MKKEEYTYLGGLVHGIGTLLTGMKTTMKVYFRKKVTEQYPENRKELKMFDRFRGTLTMPHNEQNEHRCIACGRLKRKKGKRRKYLPDMNTTSVPVYFASSV